MPADRVRVDVERRGICHISSSSIGNDRDIIAYLLVVRITSLRIKRIAHRNVSRPCDTTIGAVGIE